MADAPAEAPVCRRAFLGLGSNLGGRLGFLRGAIAALPDLVAVSSVFETEPLGGPEGQGPYLNAVAELWTAASPRSLLGLAQRLEATAGRTRGPRWGARTLDVDVLLVGDLVVDEGDLVVPHPRFAERRFVLAPLAELAPELLPPAWEERAVGEVHRLGTLDELCLWSDLGEQRGPGRWSEPEPRAHRGHRGTPGSEGDRGESGAERSAGRRTAPADGVWDGGVGEARAVVEPTGTPGSATAERSVTLDPSAPLGAAGGASAATARSGAGTEAVGTWARCAGGGPGERAVAGPVGGH